MGQIRNSKFQLTIVILQTLNFKRDLLPKKCSFCGNSAKFGGEDAFLSFLIFDILFQPIVPAAPNSNFGI